MKKIMNVIVMGLSIIFIGFVIIFSMLPNIVLNVSVTIGGFAIPIVIIIITMIIEIKKAKDPKKRVK